MRLITNVFLYSERSKVRHAPNADFNLPARITEKKKRVHAMNWAAVAAVGESGQ
jgi:hypothetical protein